MIYGCAVAFRSTDTEQEGERCNPLDDYSQPVFILSASIYTRGERQPVDQRNNVGPSKMTYVYIGIRVK